MYILIVNLARYQSKYVSSILAQSNPGPDMKLDLYPGLNPISRSWIPKGIKFWIQHRIKSSSELDPELGTANFLPGPDPEMDRIQELDFGSDSQSRFGMYPDPD
jgi:hypothetical protein